MERKKFRLYETIITLAIGLVIGWSIINEEFELSLSVLIVGMVLLYLFKRWAKAEDERVYKISEKASRITIQVFGMTIAIFGLLWWWLANKGYLVGKLGVGALGLTLIYSAFALWVLYLIFYDYYRWKYGD